MLARAGFRDDAFFAHALAEDGLADGIVDFMRPGVKQVFALQINLRATQMPGETFREIEWRGAPAEVSQ